MIDLTGDTLERVLQQGGRPVLVHFWAPWSGHCRALLPVLERLADHFAGRAVVARLNVDDQYHAAALFHITNVPTLILFEQGGVKTTRLVGFQPLPDLSRLLYRAIE